MTTILRFRFSRFRGLGCYLDSDEDGYGDIDAEEPYDKGSDCDDGDTSINPRSYELCDGVDNDCDGDTDEDSAINALAWYNDADGDGFGIDEALPSRACTQPEGYSNLNTDCDDSNPEIFRGLWNTATIQTMIAMEKSTKVRTMRHP